MDTLQEQFCLCPENTIQNLPESALNRNENQSLQSCQQHFDLVWRESLAINNVITVYPEGDVNVCTTFDYNSCVSC